MTHNNSTIGVIGAGAWGTAIAKLLSDKNSNVLLWAKEIKVKKDIEKTRINKTYLDKIELGKSLKVTNCLEELKGFDIIFVAVPTQYIQATLKPLKKIF